MSVTVRYPPTGPTDRPVLDARTAPRDQFSDPKILKRLTNVQKDKPSKVGIFRRVYARKASPRECIKAFCLECVWLDEAAIRECTATACPLFAYRPYQHPRRR